MERNLPGVLHNRQTQVVFIPEAHLPRISRVVDYQAHENKKKSFTEKALSFLRMKRGTEDTTNAMGESLREIWQKTSRSFFAKDGSKNVVVLQGGAFRVPGKGNGAIALCVRLNRKWELGIFTKTST